MSLENKQTNRHFNVFHVFPVLMLLPVCSSYMSSVSAFAIWSVFVCLGSALPVFLAMVSILIICVLQNVFKLLFYLDFFFFFALMGLLLTNIH